jgi:hypothetical protein
MTTSHLTSKHATLRGLLSAAPRRTPVVDATLVRSEMAKAIVSVVVQDFRRIAADHGRLVHAWERLALEDLQRLVWELEKSTLSGASSTMGSSARTPGRLDRY